MKGFDIVTARIKALTNEELLDFLQTMAEYRKGKDITEGIFREWLDGIFNENSHLTINDIEILLIAEGNERFGWLIKYLMLKTPYMYIRD